MQVNNKRQAKLTRQGTWGVQRQKVPYKSTAVKDRRRLETEQKYSQKRQIANTASLEAPGSTDLLLFLGILGILGAGSPKIK